MSTYTVTIDVADFVPNGVVPRLAFATIGRARIDASTGEIITEASVSYRLTATPQTIDLEENVAYRVSLAGVIGLTSTFYVRHDTASSLAELYESHQVDPATLAPAPIPPSTQDLLEQANDVLAQVQSYGFAVAVDSVDVDALKITYPDQMIDPADADAIVFTIGA